MTGPKRDGPCERESESARAAREKEGKKERRERGRRSARPSRKRKPLLTLERTERGREERGRQAAAAAAIGSEARRIEIHDRRKRRRTGRYIHPRKQASGRQEGEREIEMAPARRQPKTGGGGFGGGALSVRKALCGACVLLTGATGYVGSMLLEQLLRMCDVGAVYVLVRDKKDVSAEDRVRALLNKGVFNLLWNRPHLLAKVKVVNGDLSQDGLGILEADRRRLMRDIDYVIHSAADVALNDHIHTTLSCNYCGTKRLLDFCADMQHLRAFAHVSSAFVNITHPSGSPVEEKIYPLMHGDQVATHQEITHELLRLPPDEAAEKAQIFMKRFHFINTYCFGKHLTEQMVSDYHNKQFPVCIVRPSLVSAVARKPYPGYTGNFAGGGGFSVAFAIGLFEKDGAAWEGDHVTDVAPVDMVTSVILAATASTYQCPVKISEPPVFHACTSTTYPLTNHDLYMHAKNFFTKEPPPYCLLFGGYPDHPVNYRVKPWCLFIAKTITYIKVMLCCILMRLFRKDKVAKRLYTGWRAWDNANSPGYDFNLYMSSTNVRKLDAMLVDEEREDLLLLWTPITASWPDYYKQCFAGVKRLLLRSPLKNPDLVGFKYIPDRVSPMQNGKVHEIREQNGKDKHCVSIKKPPTNGTRSNTKLVTQIAVRAS